jgi:multiple sugar transport system permease protein
VSPAARGGIALSHFFLIVVAAFVLVPFFWIVAAGFKTQISLLQGEIFFTPTLASFREVLFSKTTEFLDNTLNSLIVAAGSTLVILVAATLGGYAIERMGTPRWLVHALLGWAVVFHMVPPITLVPVLPSFRPPSACHCTPSSAALSALTSAISDSITTCA